jgi:endonuclease YncB( thermonuclease family)
MPETFNPILVGLPFLAAVVVTTPGVARPQAEGRDDAPPACMVLYVPSAEVVQLRDGAGKVLVVQLVGVARVEAVSPGAYSALSRDRLRSLLDGEPVRPVFRPDARRISGGTRAAYLVRESDGALVNLEMVRLGYAQAGPDLPGSSGEEFREAERAAREAGVGLWAPGAAAAYERAEDAKWEALKILGQERALARGQRRLQEGARDREDPDRRDQGQGGESADGRGRMMAGPSSVTSPRSRSGDATRAIAIARGPSPAGPTARRSPGTPRSSGVDRASSSRGLGRSSPGVDRASGSRGSGLDRASGSRSSGRSSPGEGRASGSPSARGPGGKGR